MNKKFDETMLLETDRLILRKVKEEDVEDLFNNWGSDPVTTKYLTFKTQTTKEETLKFITYWKQKYEKGELQWVIEYKENHQVIGVISGIKTYKYNCIELGYSLSSKYFNNGIMTEAIKKVINYLLNNLEYNVVEVIIPSKNIASIKVAQKVGMKKEACLRDRYKDKEGNIQDLLIYSKFKKKTNDTKC